MPMQRGDGDAGPIPVMSPLLRLLLLGTLAAAGCGSDPPTPSAPSAAPGSPAPARDLRGLVYTTQPRPLRLDLYLPAGTPPFPLVVWVHGGGWQAGDRALSAGHPALRQRERGYAVASLEYRLSGEALFPAQIQDCKAALRYLRANAGTYGLAGDRVAAWGSSAGGHLVALLGTSGGVAALEDAGQGHEGQSSRVHAVVDWFGPTDFLLQPPGHHQADSPESRLLGCDIDECPGRVALANPVSHVDPADPPFFIQHGTRDAVVDIAASELMHSSLLAAGVESTLVRLEGAGHGGPEFSAAANVARIEAFLDRQLRR
jgi:acetyl esterase/lipase